jgi:peptide deformylase
LKNYTFVLTRVIFKKIFIQNGDNLKIKRKKMGQDKKRQKKQKQKKLERQIYINRILSQLKKFDYPTLITASKEVLEVNDEVKAIMKDMFRVLFYSKHGVGLAAPQIGVNVKIAAIKDTNNNIFFMINPEIIEKSKDMITAIEGCLSYPGISAPIERHQTIKVKYLDEEGKEQEKEFSNLLARVIQHEIDHFSEGGCKFYNQWKEGIAV